MSPIQVSKYTYLHIKARFEFLYDINFENSFLKQNKRQKHEVPTYELQLQVT